MINLRRYLRAIQGVGVVGLGAVLALAQGAGTKLSPEAAREEAYRANNLGVALLEQYKYKEGADEFRRALKLDDKLVSARINLAIALYNIPEMKDSAEQAHLAVAAAPTAPQPHYVLGLIARSANDQETAVGEFKKVLESDPQDVGANVNLGQSLQTLKRTDEAIAAFRAAAQAEPYNITAIYNLGQAMNRSGNREEGAKLLARFQQLRASGAGTSIGTTYLEQGRYAEAVASTGAEPDLVDKAIPKVKLALGATIGPDPAAGTPRSDEQASALVDLDNDGDLDLILAGPMGVKVLAANAGVFVDKTSASGIASGPATAVVGGDYDNDGLADLLVVASGRLRLYHNDGSFKFSDATEASKIPTLPIASYACAFVDADHDGDVDIFVAAAGKLPAGGAAPSMDAAAALASAQNVLLRNDGRAETDADKKGPTTFTDISVESKVAEPAGNALAIVPTDFDNRRDVDLLVGGVGAPRLYRNLRDGSFADVASQVGLASSGTSTAIAAADLNKDGYTDYYFASPDGAGTLAMSDGKIRFKTEPGPAGSENASAAQFVDLDNDGLMDLVVVAKGQLRAFRYVGDGWANVTDAFVTKELADALARLGGATRGFSAADVDADGDADLVLTTASGQAVVARNDGGNANRSLALRLTGRNSNRSGIGSKVEMRAGSLRERLETYSASPSPAAADVAFGLGKRASADCVRILWPTGVVQAETELPKPPDPGQAVAAMPVEELDRKPSSCPFLYAWNGERFEFVTDFMGGGEMGDWQGPGLFNTPDPDEYVRIPPDILRLRDGRVELRITNELEEVLYVDKLQLVAVSHPSDVEIYPNEGLLAAPPPFRLYATRGARPPIAAHDDAGRDVLSELAAIDRTFVKGFDVLPIRGYAAEHALTLDVGGKATDRTLLLLTGWTDYAFSSDNVGAGQSGKAITYPWLQVRDRSGAWRTVIDNIGIPVGRPQTLVVDLTGKFLSESREVRIVTNARVFWDRILVDTADARPDLDVRRLDPTSADLRWRGYSREWSPDGVAPYTYDYDDVSTLTTWKLFDGRYTREGDVRPLLRKTDDMYIVSRTGDEIALSFDVSKLPALPSGWTRTYLLYANGFSKEMDPNSASPYEVAPLPFHGMSRYPYPSTERYPLTRQRDEYLKRYNTRVIRGGMPSIDSILVEEAGARPAR